MSGNSVGGEEGELFREDGAILRYIPVGTARWCCCRPWRIGFGIRSRICISVEEGANTLARGLFAFLFFRGLGRIEKGEGIFWMNKQNDGMDSSIQKLTSG